MGFFSNNSFFFVLSQHGLSAYLPKNQTPPLVFPQEVVKNQEIKDKKTFEKLLHDYFSHFPKQHAVLFLSNEVVFQKQITLSEGKTVDDVLKAFLDTVPFIPESVEKKAIQARTNLLLFATNADLYKTIISVAQQAGVQILHVVPLLLFEKELQSHPVSYDALAHFATEKSLMNQGDLLAIKEEKQKEQIPIRQLIMLGVSLCFFAGSIVLLLINLGIISYRAEKKIIIPTPKRIITPTIAPSPTLSASDEASLKKNLEIHIVNASGVTGEAAIVKDLLSQTGYPNSTIATSASTASATTVTYVATVSASMQSEITATLAKLFPSVSSQQASSSALPVVITLGQK